MTRTFPNDVFVIVLVMAASIHIVAPINSFVSAQDQEHPPHYYSCRYNFTKDGERLPYKFCNPEISLQDRLDDLMPRLTDWEKTMVLRLEGYAIQELGIPKFGAQEIAHGVNTKCGNKNQFGNNTGCATSFPSGTGLGAMFDKEMWFDVGVVMATEARAFHNQVKLVRMDSNEQLKDGGLIHSDVELYGLDPNINLMRDPRWGRAQEVPGEDPYLTSEYAVNLVNGMQNGKTEYSNSKNPPLFSAATVKHFSFYDFEGYMPRIDEGQLPSGFCDTPSQGCQRFNSDSVPPLADFVDYFLEPFKQVITRAKPASIMCSYNAVYGKPTCADDTINNKLVREEWGFEGFFVSDCDALEIMENVNWRTCKHPYPSEGGTCEPAEFPGGHNYTHSPDETVRASLVDGGVDLNCGYLYDRVLYASLKNGAISSEDVNRAARRIFRIMILLGMLDPQEDQPWVTNLGLEDIDTDYNRYMALRAAQESLVLLKNENRTLPLKQGSRVAFIGPHAKASTSFLSNYHGENTLVKEWTPLLSAGKSHYFTEVTYALGARICDAGESWGWPLRPCRKAKGPDQDLLDQAVQLAKRMDTVVLFLGSDQTTEAESFDRHSLELAGNGSQKALLDAVTQANPNTVVVLVHGGPVAFDHSKVPAILDSFYPGEFGGKAIVDALIGSYNPGGKLPYTMYLPSFTKRDIRDTDLSSGSGITHMYFNGPVMFPFGHGLSYTEFKYSWESDGSSVVAKEDNNYIFNIRVDNVGSWAGDAVVLAFLREPYYFASSRKLRVPRAKLFGFERVPLQPGESKIVSISLDILKTTFIDEETAERVLPSGTTWNVEIGDLVNPVTRQLTFCNENEEEKVLEKNEVALQRYNEWTKEGLRVVMSES